MYSVRCHRVQEYRLNGPLMKGDLFVNKKMSVELKWMKGSPETVYLMRISCRNSDHWLLSCSLRFKD